MASQQQQQQQQQAFVPRGESDLTARTDNTTTMTDPDTPATTTAVFWNDNHARTTTTTRSTATAATVDSRFSCNICFEAVREPVVTQCGHLYCWSCLYQWLEPGMYPSEQQMLLGNTRSSGTRNPHVEQRRRCCPVCKADCSIPTIVPIYVRNEPLTPIQQQPRERVVVEPQQQPQQDESTSLSRPPEEEMKDVDANDMEPIDEPMVEHAEEEEVAMEASEEEEENNNTTGLRRRLRFRSHDSEIPNVPSRPGPSSSSSPPRHYNNNNNMSSLPVPYPYRPPRLSHGLAHSLWQSLAMQQDESSQQHSIPSLHYRQQQQQQQQAVDADATEFLWRLLLMLGSFVVLCLLIF